MSRIDEPLLAAIGADLPLGPKLVALGVGELVRDDKGRVVALALPPSKARPEWLVVSRDGQYAYALTTFEVVAGKRQGFFSRGSRTLADAIAEAQAASLAMQST